MNLRKLLPAALLLVTPFALAQGPGMPQSDDPGAHHVDRHFGPDGNDHRFGPDGGAWWKNPEVSTRIGLTPDQQKKIEDLFTQSRMHLIDLHASLEKEQLVLGPLMDANPLDQAKASAEIDKIAETRAELEKTDAKMLLSIRSVLTPDQWTKLQAEHKEHKQFHRELPQGGPQGRHQPKPGPDGPPPPPPAAQ